MRTAMTSLFQLAARFTPALCASESTVDNRRLHSLPLALPSPQTALNRTQFPRGPLEAIQSGYLPAAETRP